MEQAKKNLKIESFIVLLFAGLTLLRAATEIIFTDFSGVTLPADAPKNTILIAQIVLASITLLMLWPQIYIGIKGLVIAKNPNTTRRHIFWGKVLFVFAILSMISPAIAIIRQEEIGENTYMILSLLVEVVIFFDYVKHAKAVAKIAAEAN